MASLLGFVGRILIALLFIVSGISKLIDIGGTQAMLASVGLPAMLALPVALFELLGGLALVAGVATRFVSVLLAGFCLLAGLMFHMNFADPVQSAMLLKNVAIAGGLLCLTGLDTVRWSYDAMRERRRAERDAHDADVRAARAEGAAVAVRSHEADKSAIRGRTVVTDVDGDGVPEVRRRGFI